MSDDDKSLAKQALYQTIGFKRKPPTIDEALDSEYYLKKVFPIVYPFWRERLRELFPDEITSTAVYVVLTGAIGGGKSTFAEIVIAYDLIKMTCMEDVGKYSDIQLLQGSYVKCVNIYKIKVREFINLFVKIVWGGASPFFQRELEKGNAFLKGLHIQACAKEKDLISDDVPIFWLNEISYMKPEVALQMISSASSRLSSRFLRAYNIFAHIILDSSTVGTESAMETFLKSDPNAKSAMVVRVTAWNTVPAGRYFNYGEFYVYAGDSKTTPFVVPKDFPDNERNRLDPEQFIRCPMELYAEAKRDIVLFLREKCGIATTSSSKFFRDIKKLSQSFNIPMFCDDVVKVDFFDPVDTLYPLLRRDIENLPIDRKLYIRLDCGVASDIFGISIAYADGLNRSIIDGQQVDRLNIKIPISFGVSRYDGQETPINKIEDFILQLNQTHEVAEVDTDQYQSTEIRQIMKQNGIRSELISVDRNDSAYVVSKNYIYSGLVSMADNQILIKEASEVERVSPTKIDHPPKQAGGSKDLLDTAVGLIARMVELGPEEVLSPPESHINQGLIDIYDKMYKSRESSMISHGTMSTDDYLSF